MEEVRTKIGIKMVIISLIINPKKRSLNSYYYLNIDPEALVNINGSPLITGNDKDYIFRAEDRIKPSLLDTTTQKTFRCY